MDLQCPLYGNRKCLVGECQQNNVDDDCENKHISSGDHQRLDAGGYRVAKQLAKAAAVLAASLLHVA
ncbi:hypothetical protein D3C74_397860 [compost metagenome]